MVPKCQPNVFKNESKTSGEVNTVAVFMCSFIPECLFKAFLWGGGGGGQGRLSLGLETSVCNLQSYKIICGKHRKALCLCEEPSALTLFKSK